MGHDCVTNAKWIIACVAVIMVCKAKKYMYDKNKNKKLGKIEANEANVLLLFHKFIVSSTHYEDC